MSHTRTNDRFNTVFPVFGTPLEFTNNETGLTSSLTISRYVIGEGSHAKVFKGSYRQLKAEDTEVPVAVKVFRGLDAYAARKISTEAHYQQLFSHSPYILKLIEYRPAGGNILIVSDYMPDTLEKKIDRELLTGLDLLQTTYRIALSLDTMHSAGYVHRDVKPGNILLNSLGEPKLCDFGETSRVDFPVKFCGTPDFIPYELLSFRKVSFITPKSDIYSLGITMLIMSHGYEVLEDPEFSRFIDKMVYMFSFSSRLGDTEYNALLREAQKHKDISQLKTLRTELKLREEINATKLMSELTDNTSDFLGLILACTDMDPAKRPTAKQLMGYLQILIDKLKNSVEKIANATPVEKDRPEAKGVISPLRAFNLFPDMPHLLPVSAIDKENSKKAALLPTLGKSI